MNSVHIWSSPVTIWAYRIFPWWSTHKKEFYEHNGHAKYGIRLQDVPVHNKVVTKALNRLPLEEMEARNRRLKQASVLFTRRETLPEEQHTKFEDDYDYLTPYILDVMEEDHDRLTWRL